MPETQTAQGPKERVITVAAVMIVIGVLAGWAGIAQLKSSLPLGFLWLIGAVSFLSRGIIKAAKAAR
jgi:hypothetical protein